MTREEKESLLCCLEAVCEIDRQASCSDRFFDRSTRRKLLRCAPRDCSSACATTLRRNHNNGKKKWMPL